MNALGLHANVGEDKCLPDVILYSGTYTQERSIDFDVLP